MKKSEAAKLAVSYMNNQDLIKAREKDQEKMRQRRALIDLEDNTDLYGNKQNQGGFEVKEDDIFGAGL